MLAESLLLKYSSDILSLAITLFFLTISFDFTKILPREEPHIGPECPIEFINKDEFFDL